MRRITYDDLKQWHACGMDNGEPYSREVLDRRLGTGWSLLLVEVLSLDWVPAEDRIWVATHPDVLTEEQMTAWLGVVVTRAEWAHALGCGVPTVEQWATRWLSGEDRTAARAAWAARAAAWAAEEAARAAAWAAAWAAEEAGWEREQQVRDLLGVLMSDRGAR
jgi:hypothetical protein